MQYTLMTGATGLLGGYLLRDSLLAERPMAVIVRSSRMESARQRIESILARFEELQNRVLPRPVVLSGDLTQPMCGLDEPSLEWVRTHCDSMLHNAASLSFYHDEKTGEPERSNIEGTRRVLELCQHANITEFHHISTAYVCGLRTGTCLESELDIGQEFGNDYERSKVEAEKMVRAADFLSCSTFYRPAIIIGDSQTGYTSSFHGFFTPLKVASALVGGAVSPELTGQRILPALGFTLTDRKNFVPVDWVSAVVTHILQSPEHHRQTYNLVPRTPVTLALTTQVIEDSLSRKLQNKNGAPSGPRIDLFSGLEMFREQMQVYRSYWRDDPDFDFTNTALAAPHLPCPAVDYAMLMRMAMYALDSRFGWPQPQPIVPKHDLHDLLIVTEDQSELTGDVVGLRASGPGGGEWTLSVRESEVEVVAIGLPSNPLAVAYMNTLDFDLVPQERLRSGRLHFEFKDGSEHLKTMLADSISAWIAQALHPQEVHS